jgi:hypothetical protein
MVSKSDAFASKTDKLNPVNSKDEGFLVVHRICNVQRKILADAYSPTASQRVLFLSMRNFQLCPQRNARLHANAFRQRHILFEPFSRSRSFVMSSHFSPEGQRTIPTEPFPCSIDLIHKDDNDDLPHAVGADATVAVLAPSADTATSQQQQRAATTTVGGGATTAVGFHNGNS